MTIINGAFAATITVNTSGSADYISIGSAVNASSSGDIILVEPGTYIENIRVNKQLNIRSTGGASVTNVTAASADDHVFEINTDGVILSGFNVSNNYVSGNNVSSNHFASGIFLNLSSNNTIENNVVSKNFFGINLFSSSNNTIENNKVLYNQRGIFLDSSSNNNTLINNTPSNNLYTGIFLDGCCNNAVTNNTVSENKYSKGIWLESANNNIIEKNNVSNNREGIWIISSGNNQIQNNTVSYNGLHGMRLVSSNNNLIKNNSISYTDHIGISLSSSSNNLIKNNSMSCNGVQGISLYSSSNNTLISNIESTNYNGIYGNNYVGICLGDSCNNLIWNNHFSGYISNGGNIGNVWNITKTAGLNIAGGPYLGGNYWADSDGTGFSQTCNDSDGDGISDSYYSLDEENIDYLPLVEGDFSSIITVNASGSADYTSIRLAVTAANPGDTILVEPGTYKENVIVNKQLNIISTGGASVTNVAGIDSDFSYAFVIAADGVKISGFSIFTHRVGIDLYSNNNTIENNNISGNLLGLSLDSSCTNIIKNNKMSHNIYRGLGLSSSCNNLIYNNFFNNSDNIVFNGTNTGNVWNITKTTGLNVAGGSYLGGNYWADSNGTGFSQTCNDSNGDGISDSYYSLDGENIDYLPLIEVDPPSIITVNANGGADYTSINLAVTAANPSDTILVEPGTYRENVIVDKQLNISSTGGAAVTNVDGDGHGSFSCAFYLTADEVRISGFSVYNHRAGIRIYSSNNTIENNNISSNAYGLCLSSSCNNVIKNNKVSNSYTYGLCLSSSCNNLIYNNFLNNSDNIDFDETNTGNVWNITKTEGVNVAGGSYLGGNYWANPDGTGFSQTCNDLDGDDISDSYYSLDGENIDYLPLAKDYLTPSIITVNADGSEDYASIQSAVTAAKPGDIILVEPGTYNENVVVNKQLNIRSTGGASVTSVIADSADDHVFEIIADEVTINGFSVTGDYVASGIYLNSSSNSIIENNNFSHNLDSIYLFSSSNNLIENNNILQSNTGIVLDSSPDNKLTDNVVSNSSNGIYLDESCNNTLESNIVSDTNNAGGINLLNSCNNFIWNNYFSGYGSYGTNTGNVWNITKTQGTNIAGGPYLGGNYWANSNGTGFSQTCNDSDGISDSYYSLDAENIDYLPLVEVYYPSIITVNTSGSADYTSIQSAVTAANPSDIILVEPGIYKENIVVNKQLNISSTGGAAVTNVAGIDSDFSYAFVITADGVKVSGFSIFTHRVGIDLYSNNNTIENNNLSCNLLGFSLDSSSDNIIKNNKVTNNNYRGIYLESSCNNLIYNNFFNNSDNIGFNGTNTGNVWNITKTQGANIAGGPSLGGNCWASSDGTGFSQTCNDSNGDGISDSYYSLDGNNIDYLPLVEQYIDIPPSSVGGLSETNAGSSWIEWSWVNPQDYDFSHSMICLDGVFRENVSGTSYTAEGLDENTTYEIQIRTVDYAGNVNNSQINDTATTDNDWNPWNDPDSENGAVISLHEVQDAIVYWKYSTPCPETGYIMSLNDMQDIVIYWKYQVPM